MYRYLCWYLSLQISMKYLETSYFAAVKYLEISHFATTTWVFRQYQVGDIFQIYCRFWKILTYIHIDICSNEIFRNILLCNIHMGRPSTPLICTYPPLGPYSHQNWKSCLNQIKNLHKINRNTHKLLKKLWGWQDFPTLAVSLFTLSTGEGWYWRQGWEEKEEGGGGEGAR